MEISNSNCFFESNHSVGGIEMKVQLTANLAANGELVLAQHTNLYL